MWKKPSRTYSQFKMELIMKFAFSEDARAFFMSLRQNNENTFDFLEDLARLNTKWDEKESDKVYNIAFNLKETEKYQLRQLRKRPKGKITQLAWRIYSWKDGKK